VQADVSSPSRAFDFEASLIPCQDEVGLNQEGLTRFAQFAFLRIDIASDVIGHAEIIELRLDCNPFTVVLKLTRCSIEPEGARTLAVVIDEGHKTIVLAMQVLALLMSFAFIAKEASETRARAASSTTSQNSSVVADHITTGIKVINALAIRSTVPSRTTTTAT